MLDNYISKVKIGSTVYPIGDKIARKTASNALSTAESKVAGVDNANSLAFKIDGNYYGLLLDNSTKQIKLGKITYNAPTISTTATWGGSSTLNYNIDADVPASVDNNGKAVIAGTITVKNGIAPTVSTTQDTVDTITINKTSTDNVYSFSGDVTVANNGSASITFETTGTMANPASGAKETASKTITVKRNLYMTNGYIAYNSKITPTSNTSGGIKFNMDDNAQTPVSIELATTMKNFKITTAGYIYIFTTTNYSEIALNPTESAIQNTGGGTERLKNTNGNAIQLNSYTAGNKKYYVYRSMDSYPANTTLYVRGIGG